MSRSTIVAVYGAGLVQGIAMISFAAASAVFKEKLGFTDAEYGAIFIPQVVLATLGAAGGGALTRALGLRSLLRLGFAVTALSQVTLAAAGIAGPGPALPLVFTATSLMGLGAGMNAAPLNTYPQALFPARADTAIVAVHTVMGLGLGAGPLLLAGAEAAGSWILFPLVLLALCVVAVVSAARVPLPEARTPDGAPGPHGTPAAYADFWLFLAIAVLYALSEASFSNWAVLYLREDKGLAPAAAASALTTFWVALSASRILAAVLVLRVPAERIWLGLPLPMAAAFLLLPAADSPPRALAVYALAGFGCSAFFPLTVRLASRRFPDRVAGVSSSLFGGLALGVGGATFLLGALRAWKPLPDLFPLCAAAPALALLLALLTRIGAQER